MPLSGSYVRNELDSLVIGFQALSKMSEPEKKVAMRQLRRDYSKLYESACLEDVEKLKLKPSQRELAKFFQLGRKEFEAFHAHMTNKIVANPDKTATAIAEFCKSDIAFQLLRSSSQPKLSPDDMRKVSALLGGMLGVEIGAEFVKAVKTEMMGRVIGYALSGLCRKDMEAFEALPPATRPTKDAWLLERIMSSSSELVYRLGEHAHGSADHPIACAINEGAGATSLTAPRLRADACFVNHDTKTIVFGNSTSNNSSDKKQSVSATRFAAALALMVDEEFITDGLFKRANPYYKYKVKPFYFHAGAISVSRAANAVKGAGSSLVKMLGGNVSEKDCEAIAKLSFFSLLGEDNPSAIIGRILAQFNVHICGCDTEALYNEMCAANASPRNPRRFAEIVLSGLIDAAKVLARKDTNISLSALGQNLLQPVLETLSKVSDNHLLNFPTSKLTSKEGQLLGTLGEHLSAIADKLVAENSDQRGLLIKHLRRLSAEFSTPSSRRKLTISIAELTLNQPANQKLAKTNGGSTLKSSTFSWQRQAATDLNGNAAMNKEGLPAFTAAVDEILTCLSQKRIPPILVSARALAISHPSWMSYRAWFEEMADQAFNTMGGGHFANKIARNKTVGSFAACFSLLRYTTATDHPGVAVAKALQPFFRRKVWGNRPSMLKGNPHARKAAVDMLKALLSIQADSEQAAKFIHELHALGTSPRPANNRLGPA